MALAYKLLCLSVSALLTINASKENTSSNKDDATEVAPFIQNVNALMNHKVTKMMKNGIEVAKDYLVQYGEEFTDKINENHSKTPKDPNALTPNLIKHNLVDPTKALSQVSFKRLQSLHSEINEEYQKNLNENEKSNRSIKRLASKPFSFGKATLDVLANKASNFVKKISVDDDSKENKVQGNNKRTSVNPASAKSRSMPTNSYRTFSVGRNHGKRQEPKEPGNTKKTIKKKGVKE